LDPEKFYKPGRVRDESFPRQGWCGDKQMHFEQLFSYVLPPAKLAPSNAANNNTSGNLSSNSQKLNFLVG
jgi:hypothetical protein